jgi:hypothetical protein
MDEHEADDTNEPLLRGRNRTRRHRAKCSTCSHISRRLVLSPTPPVANLPLIVQHPEPPATKLQLKHAAAGSARAKLAEKLRSRQTAAQDRAALAIRSTWLEAVEKLRHRKAALEEQKAVASHPEPAEPVRAPAAPSGTSAPSPPPNDPAAPQSRWERAVAKVRAKQEGGA